jgi:predicted DsbA family dithiol-disulfide isomerase
MTGTPGAVRVDVVSDVVCPWCAIGWAQLARAAEETGVALDVRWRPFQLNPDMGPEGESHRAHVARKYGMSDAQVDAGRARMSALGAEVGFDFDWWDGLTTVNTLRAHRLLRWAEPQGRAHALKLALLAAHFQRRLRVDDPETLAEIASGVDLDRDGVAALLSGEDLAAETRAEAEWWRARGVDGVPTMIFAGRHAAVGAQGVDAYARLLRQLSAGK